MQERYDQHGKRVSRRRFLAGSAFAAGCLAVSAGHRLLGLAPRAAAQEVEMTPQAYLPLGMKAESNPRVVHVHASSATFWDFQTGWYGDYVDQDVVYGMMDQGLMRLTGTSTRAVCSGAESGNQSEPELCAQRERQ
jgi:hypothetical protein